MADSCPSPVSRFCSVRDKLLLWVGAAALRLFVYTFFFDFLIGRPELVVPQTSYRRVLDGVYMLRDGISPFDGDMVHCQPVLLHLLGPVIDFPGILILIYTIVDIITAEVLQQVAYAYGMTRKEFGFEKTTQLAFQVSKIYLLNPVTICTCAVLSLSSLYNFFTALFIFTFVAGRLFVSSFIFAVLVHFTLYPAIYICALLVRFSTLKQRLYLLVVSFLSLALLIALNGYLNGSWNYIDSTYMFLLDVRDLTPNVGVFWYFFIEVFNHFRNFFLWVFQMNILVYLIPLTLTVRTNSFLLLNQLMILIAVFSSYPSLAESSVYLSLMILFENLKKYFRWNLVAGTTMITAVILAPITWQMWIITGSGNANFYFAATISYSIAQIFLLTDLLYGHLREQVTKERGEQWSDATILVLK